MKRIYLLIAILALAVSVPAQEYEMEYESESEEYSEEVVEEEPSGDCYQKWASLYEARGAEEVADGSYEDVVIVVDKAGSRECYAGKANVFKSKLVCTSVQLAASNGEYREPAKTRAIPVSIQNGIATPFQAGDSKIIVIFPKSLKPKASDLLKAPEPVE